MQSQSVTWANFESRPNTARQFCHPKMWWKVRESSNFIRPTEELGCVLCVFCCIFVVCFCATMIVWYVLGGLTPLQDAIVNTRIITCFLGILIPINLHLPLLVGGCHTQGIYICIYGYEWIHKLSKYRHHQKVMSLSTDKSSLESIVTIRSETELTKSSNSCQILTWVISTKTWALKLTWGNWTMFQILYEPQSVSWNTYTSTTVVYIYCLLHISTWSLKDNIFVWLHQVRRVRIAWSSWHCAVLWHGIWVNGSKALERRRDEKVQGGNPTWRIIQDLDTWLVTMVIVSPQDLGLWDPLQMAFSWLRNVGY